MPITVVQEKETLITTAATTWSPSFDAEVTPGNVVVIMTRLVGNRTLTTPTGGSGSFALVQSIGSTSNSTLSMWSKVENNSGVTGYTITVGSSLSSPGFVQMYELSGCDSATPASSGTGTQNTTTTSPQLVDTALTIESGGILVGIMGTQIAASWGTLTDPTNFTRAYANNSGTGTASVFVGHSTTAATVNGTGTTTNARAIWGIGATWIEAATGQPTAKRLGGVPFNGFRRRGVW